MMGGDLLEVDGNSLQIRDRIIEVLDWIVDLRERVPECGFDELVNQWDDWVLPLKSSEFSPQAFTLEEVAAIRCVDGAMDAFANVTPPSIPDIQATLELAQWSKVVAATEMALGIMRRDGQH